MDNQGESLGKRILEFFVKRETVLGTIIIVMALIYALWPLLTMPNDYYPATVDGMGHLTKVQYFADCFREMKWPSWFPYWYNGSTVVQYYPPLSYLLLVPIQLAFDNIMITFKFFGLSSLFLGSLGVWQIARRFIGPWVGVPAAVIYLFDPFLLRSLFLSGVVAQGPIYILSPWFLYFSLLFFRRREKSSWLLISLGTALLILSHAMHAFMIAFIIGFLALVLIILKEMEFKRILFWGLAAGLGASLVAFWWVPGVTSWENPGIPYLLQEAIELYTAKIEWFAPKTRFTGSLYFSYSLLLISFITIFLSHFMRSKVNKRQGLSSGGKLLSQKEHKWFLALAFALFFSVLFSLGKAIPGFRFLPMASSLVPGRILSFTTILAAIVFAYFLWFLYQYWTDSSKRIIGVLIIVLSIAFIYQDINPRIISFNCESYQLLNEELELFPKEEIASKNGRFVWVIPVTSEITYFPMLKKLYMTDGWNIEGTPHNRAIWQHNLAIPEGCDDYILRNLLFWNTRSAFISNRYTGLMAVLKENGFQFIKSDWEKEILFNPLPSSYYLWQERDALVIGKAAINLEMHFPWLLRGYSNCLEDYPWEYLSKFKLIYLIEPEIKDFACFQQRVEDLARAGQMVIVSMGREKTWPLLGAIPYWETLVDDAQLIATEKSTLTGWARIKRDPAGQMPVIGNLDEVWATIWYGDKEIPTIGYKKTNDGSKVYFVGVALGQQLNAADGAGIKMLLEQLMDLAEPNKSIIPTSFPILTDEWSHKGLSFSYAAPEDAEILVSITYTPRWQGKINGELLPVQNMDNLIYLELPAGEHQVSLSYGLSWVGKLGIILSLIAVISLVAFYYCYNDINMLYLHLSNRASAMITGLGK